MAPERDDTAALLSAVAEEVGSAIASASKRLSEHADAIHRRLGQGDLTVARPVARQSENVEAILQRVREALREDRSAALKPSDARAAARNFAQLSPEEVSQLLRLQPSCWRRFVGQLFRERLNLPSPQWTTWARLAENAPRGMTLLHGPLERRDLLHEDHSQSAAAIARRWGRMASLAELDAKICAPGLLNRAWPYSSLVFARWAELHSDRWTRTWDEVASEVLFEAMLLPRKDEKSWFARSQGTPFPIGIPENIESQVRFVAACLDPHLKGEAVDDGRAESLIRILTAVWKDPRSLWRARDRPQYAGWKQFAEIAPTTYDRLLERLLAADLDLFFENIEFDKERRRYWRRHLKKMVATTFFFSTRTIAELKRKFPSGHPMHEKVSSALLRARGLYGGGGLDALVLGFRSGVVIEFSQVNNAAYLYTHEQYNKLISGLGRYATASTLKNAAIGGKQLIHTSEWQSDFDRHVASIG